MVKIKQNVLVDLAWAGVDDHFDAEELDMNSIATRAGPRADSFLPNLQAGRQRIQARDPGLTAPNQAGRSHL